MNIFEAEIAFDDDRPTFADIDSRDVVTVRYDDGAREVIAVMPLDAFRYFREEAERCQK